MIPLSRGASHVLENLCYACRRCNQMKLYRTADEFAQRPHDAASQIRVDLTLVITAVELEAQRYDGFANKRLAALWRRMGEVKRALRVLAEPRWRR